MVSAVRQAKVKHAYAASSSLEPIVGYVRTLIANGLIGTLIGIELMSECRRPMYLENAGQPSWQMLPRCSGIEPRHAQHRAHPVERDVRAR